MYVLADLRVRSFDLIEPADCKRFHVEVVGGEGEQDLAQVLRECGRVDPPDHAWISIDAVRRMARGCTPEAWDVEFDAMVAYAESKGWLDEQREHIRAHIEWIQQPGLG